MVPAKMSPASFISLLKGTVVMIDFFFIKPYILVARFVIRSQVTPDLTSNSSFDSRAHTVQMEG